MAFQYEDVTGVEAMDVDAVDSVGAVAVTGGVKVKQEK